MADQEVSETPASVSSASLAQFLLAPLDAIFKAQLHSARSFLNLVLQLGFRHQKVDADGHAVIDSSKDGKPFYLEFFHDSVIDGETRTQKISVPALAAVPIAPLAVESAEFSFDVRVQGVTSHQQNQDSRGGDQGGFGADKRPWFLVDKPVSILGSLGAAAPSDADNAALIRVKVNVGPAKMPAGLNKFITSLGEMAGTQDVTPPPVAPNPPADTQN